MTEFDPYYFKVAGLDVTSTSLVECGECKASSYAHEYTHTEVGCEVCGTHPALQCPKCQYDHDYVIDPRLTVVKV